MACTVRRGPMRPVACYPAATPNAFPHTEGSAWVDELTSTVGTPSPPEPYRPENHMDRSASAVREPSAPMLSAVIAPGCFPASPRRFHQLRTERKQPAIRVRQRQRFASLGTRHFRKPLILFCKEPMHHVLAGATAAGPMRCRCRPIVFPSAREWHGLARLRQRQAWLPPCVIVCWETCFKADQRPDAIRLMCIASGRLLCGKRNPVPCCCQ
jgi:hypothetical protein